MPGVKDISFIRKLCALDLPPQTLAQCLLPELRKLIPSHSAGVFWVDGDGEMTNLFAERLLPPNAMADYYAKHYATKAGGFVEAFRRRASSDDPISLHSFSREEQSTEYFRDVMHRLDAYHILYAILRDGSRPFAQISFYRGLADNRFDRPNVEMLRSLKQYLASGLRPDATRATDAGPAVVAEECLGIVAASGQPLSASDDWQRLLRLAAVAELSPRRAMAEREAAELFSRQICDAVFVAKQKGITSHESIHDTAWGRFLIRGFLLADAKGRRAEQIGMLIRREEPRSLSLVRGTGRAALSPQQREVALLLVERMTNREIANALGLSLNTASYHVKQVFARLEVNGRGDVAKRLLDLAQSVVAQ
jgi:DNA-binding CsgD family transcriptional regulator